MRSFETSHLDLLMQKHLPPHQTFTGAGIPLMLHFITLASSERPSSQFLIHLTSILKMKAFMGHYMYLTKSLPSRALVLASQIPFIFVLAASKAC